MYSSQSEISSCKTANLPSKVDEIQQRKAALSLRCHRKTEYDKLDGETNRRYYDMVVSFQSNLKEKSIAEVRQPIGRFTA